MAVAFPYMEDEDLDKSKHPKRNPLHLKDAIFDNLQPYHSYKSITFDIGSGALETTHPYYHILENSQVIRKRGLGTKKSKGSQASVLPSKRDYERVKWNGKTYSKEYRKNVRGSRSLLEKSQYKVWIVDDQGIATKAYANPQADFYANKHYLYIENMMNNGILDQLASEFGLKRKRTQSSGLEEEWLLQERMDYGMEDNSDILNIFKSFEEN